MDLLTRIKLPMNKFWKKFQKLCVVLAFVVPTTGELGTYFHFIPEGTITNSIKATLGIMILLGILLPKLSVDSESKDKLKDNV